MKNSLFLIALSFIISTGCVDEYVSENQEDSFSTDFEYNTVSEEKILINLTYYGKPIDGVLVKLWKGLPGKDGEIILKGVTDQSGNFQSQYNLAHKEQTYILETGFIGLPNYIMLTRDEVISEIIVTEDGSRYTLLSDEDIPGNSHPEDVNSENAKSRVLNAPIQYIDTYDERGVPNNLEPRDVVSEELLTFINASLPEGKPVPQAHPGYLASDAQPNLVVEATADVWATFVHEGAGYRNVLAFYTYATGSEPTSTSEIESLNVMFPNASFAWSGGGLYTGDKVYLGRFEPGTTIGFALMANGWQNGASTYGNHVVYSNNVLNPESTEENRYHTVLLWDDVNELFLLGFEDLNRDGSSDDDFNDAIIYLTSNPVEAISTENVNPIDKPVDSDGDGVNDTYDEYPGDSRYAYNYAYPGENSYGTFAFEDQWPNVGDYDFNDLVADYQYRQIANASNEMVQLEAEFIIQAAGAGFKSGFGIQLEVSPSSVASVSGNRIYGNLFELNANGTEAGQSKTVIPISDDVHRGFDGYGFINTDPALPYQNPDTILTSISFSNGMDLSAAGAAPFNPFLVINQERGKEVHISGYAPTDKVNSSFFGQVNDDTDLSTQRYYKTKVGLPWGMNLPESFNYPKEKQDIMEGYLHFRQWSQSGGFSYMDWYSNKNGYRNTSVLFKNNN